MSKILCTFVLEITDFKEDDLPFSLTEKSGTIAIIQNIRNKDKIEIIRKTVFHPITLPSQVASGR